MTDAAWSHPGYAKIAAFLSAHAGLAFPPNRRDTAELRVARAMKLAGVDDFDAYLQRIRADGAALDDLIAEITVKESYFFRDINQFDVLRGDVLPALRRARNSAHRFRVWSAGCAAGQEAYSLAILFSEAGLGERANILGTDISRDCLKDAAEATFTGWSFRDNDPAFIDRYFRRRGRRFELAERFRRQVTFQYLNLAVDTYPSWASGFWGMDLILCRNVLIYFDPATVQRVGRQLLACLADGGWLMTGASDPPIAAEPPYEPIITRAGIVYRRGEPGVAIRPASPPAWPERDRAGAVAASEDAPAPMEPAPPRPEPVEPPAREDHAGPIDAAREAFARGDYARAVDLTEGLGDGVESSTLMIRSLSALGDLDRAENAAAAAVAWHPLAPELHLLHAAVLVEMGRYDDADRSLRRVIYLDPSLGVAYLALGAVLWRRGDLDGARRAYSYGHTLFARRATDEIAPLADGERAGRLAEAAAAHVTLLDAYREAQT